MTSQQWRSRHAFHKVIGDIRAADGFRPLYRITDYQILFEFFLDAAGFLHRDRPGVGSLHAVKNNIKDFGFRNESPRSKLRGIKSKGKERSKLQGINPAEIKET